ncbi:hypothetical protein GC163_10160 [bacterium]|nr:hypothetical protein [bacterium]
MQPMSSQSQRLFHSNRRSMSYGNRRLRRHIYDAFLLGMLSFLLLGNGGLFAGEDIPKDHYQVAWDEVSEFLRQREYGSAAAKLDSLAKEQDLRNYGTQVEADRKAIHQLLVLERIVLEQAAQLEPGSSIEISGIEYTLVRYEKSTRSDALILKSKSLGRETKKSIVDLPAGTWVELAELDLVSLESPELTLGIFLTFDRIADRKAARKLFNEAAATGEDVSVWLTRLEAAEKQLAVAGKPGKGDDPIVGKWDGQIGPRGGVQATYHFQKKGTGMITVDPKVLATLKPSPGQTLQQFETAKRLFQLVRFSWDKKEDGTYRVTLKDGLGTFDGLILEGDQLQHPGDTRKFVRQVQR